MPCAFHTLLITVHQCDLPLRSTNVLHKPNVHFRDFIWIQVKDLNTSKDAVRMEHKRAKHSQLSQKDVESTLPKYQCLLVLLLHSVREHYLANGFS